MQIYWNMSRLLSNKRHSLKSNAISDCATKYQNDTLDILSIFILFLSFRHELRDIILKRLFPTPTFVYELSSVYPILNLILSWSYLYSSYYIHYFNFQRIYYHDSYSSHWSRKFSEFIRNFSLYNIFSIIRHISFLLKIVA